MDLKEDLDKKLQNKQSIDEWLKSYQNAINVPVSYTHLRAHETN